MNTLAAVAERKRAQKAAREAKAALAAARQQQQAPQIFEVEVLEQATTACDRPKLLAQEDAHSNHVQEEQQLGEVTVQVSVSPSVAQETVTCQQQSSSITGGSGVDEDHLMKTTNTLRSLFSKNPSRKPYCARHFGGFVA